MPRPTTVTPHPVTPTPVPGPATNSSSDNPARPGATLPVKDDTVAKASSTATQAPSSPDVASSSARQSSVRESTATESTATESPVPESTVPESTTDGTPSVLDRAKAGVVAAAAVAKEKVAQASTAATTTVPAPVPVGVGRAPERAAVRRPRRTRRARLRISRIDPWSVMKTSLLFGIAGGIIFVVATYVLMSVVEATGLFEAVNSMVKDVLASPSDTSTFDITTYINTKRATGLAALIGAIDVVIFTALATVFSFLYNLSATMLGGLEITLAED
ncbi:MAG: DUF3566 domain-containing protein [Actinobacteria bacterium]|nr:DUF3566 domain-containing protein [Actinomycetota bacterium]